MTNAGFLPISSNVFSNSVSLTTIEAAPASKRSRIVCCCGRINLPFGAALSIGTTKITRWLKQYTGKDFDIHTSSGNSFPEDLDTYDLVIHCGGCTLNRREMKNRIARVKDAGVPIVNYGIFIAATQGILKRTLEPFEEASRILNEI